MLSKLYSSLNNEIPFFVAASIFVRTLFLIAYVASSAIIIYVHFAPEYQEKVTPNQLIRITETSDFHVFHVAGRLASAEDYETLYSQKKFNLERKKSKNVEDDFVLAFNYPPTALLFYTPLSKVDINTATIIWLAAGFIGIMLVTYKLSASWQITCLVSISPFILFGLSSGQNGVISTTILTAGFLAREQNKPLLAGLIFGLLAFKPHLALALPFCFLVTRDWRVIVGGVTSTATLCIASLLIFGPEAWSVFFSNFSHNSEVVLSSIEVLYMRIPTVFMTLTYLTGDMKLSMTAHIVTALIAIICCMWVWRYAQDTLSKLICLFLTPAFISPYIFDYDIVGIGILFGLILIESYKNKMLNWNFILLIPLWLMGFTVFTSRLNGDTLAPLLFIGLMCYAVFRTYNSLKEDKKAATS